MRSCQKHSGGAVQIVVIVALVLIAAVTGVAGKKALNLFNPDGKQKKETTVLVSDVQATQQAEKAAEEARKEADANAAAIAKAKQARYDVAHQHVMATGLALAREQNPSNNVKAALLFNSLANQDMDALTDQQKAAVTALVIQILSSDQAQIDQAHKQIDALQASVAQAKASEEQHKALEASLNDAKAKAEASVTALEQKSVQDSSDLAKWAADNKTLLQKLKEFTFWSLFATALFLLVFWLLPILAKAFPIFGPFATALHAALALPMSLLHKAETEAISIAHQATQNALDVKTALLQAEQEAHASTKATLVAVATATASK